MSNKTLDYHFHKAIVLLFLLAIFAPAVKMAVSPPVKWSGMEKRRLAVLPALPSSPMQMPEFFSQLSNYLNDHFGYRDVLIHRYYREIKKRFGKTGMESRVLLGQEGWYYYSAGNEIEDFTGQLPLSRQQLEAWTAERWRRADWLKAKGIAYLVLIPPNKTSIYPEFLPAGMASLKGTSRLEQLLEFAESKPMPFLVNLRQPLLQAKQDHQLFYKTDTHWNMRGAFVAFREIVKTLEKQLPAVQLTTSFSFGPDTIRPCRNSPFDCDLARMAMQQEEAVETFPTLSDFKQCAEPYDIQGFNLSHLPQREDAPSFGRGCAQKNLTAVVFRDSFFIALQPFLSENFGRVVYLWKRYDQTNIEEVLKFFTPDVVIEEIVERDSFGDIVN